MRSVTSYFNPTLYKKNLSRFWPLWTAWLVLWAFLLPLNQLNEWRRCSGGEEYDIYRYFRSCLNFNGIQGEAAVVFGVVYAALCAMAVFSYLYNHRSAATIHALPLRRECLFVTNYLSGLTFFVLPNVVVYLSAALLQLVTLPGELSAMTLSCLWSGFWVKTGVEFFFYTFAVFCAQFTGNILALPVFYGILNCLTAALYMLFQTLGDAILYGGWPLVGEPRLVKLLTPIYALVEATRWDYVSWDNVWNSDLVKPEIWGLNLTFENPGLVAGYAVAGVALSALALLVYRRRHIETAGDVVSVRIVRPIFRIGVAVCAGLSGGIVTAAFFGEMDHPVFMTAWVAFWTAVGYFAAEMLLQKSFRIFRRSWKGCAAAALAMVLVMAGLCLDVLGVETWVPDPDKVENMTLTLNSTYPYDDASHLVVMPEDAAGKQRIVNIHEAILRDYKTYGEGFHYGEELMSINLTYTMKNGMTYSKGYYDVEITQDDINDPGTTTGMLQELVNDPEIVAQAYNWDRAKTGRIVATGLKNVIYPTGRYEMVECADGAQEIWEAVQADFAAGKLGVRYLFDNEVRRTQTYRTDLTLYFMVPNRGQEDYVYGVYGEVYIDSTKESGYTWNFAVDITLTPQAGRTLAALEKYYDLGGEYRIALHDEELK